jgi:hypothetical protein
MTNICVTNRISELTPEVTPRKFSDSVAYGFVFLMRSGSEEMTSLCSLIIACNQNTLRQQFSPEREARKG